MGILADSQSVVPGECSVTRPFLLAGILSDTAPRTSRRSFLNPGRSPRSCALCPAPEQAALTSGSHSRSWHGPVLPVLAPGGPRAPWRPGLVREGWAPPSPSTCWLCGRGEGSPSEGQSCTCGMGTVSPGWPGGGGLHELMRGGWPWAISGARWSPSVPPGAACSAPGCLSLEWSSASSWKPSKHVSQGFLPSVTHTACYLQCAFWLTQLLKSRASLGCGLEHHATLPISQNCVLAAVVICHPAF